MTSFDLYLQSASQYEHVSDVKSFVAEDDSGLFGIMAGHARFMTTLHFGLARYRCGENDWEYLALPGALLYFNDKSLTINTRHFIRSSDYSTISEVLQKQLRREEENLEKIKHSLHHMEEEMLKRMWEIRRAGASLL